MLLNSKRSEYKIIDLGQDILIVAIYVLITTGLGLFLLIFIGKPDSPFVPQYLLREPFQIYSTLIIGYGLGIPFIFRKRTDKCYNINEIGK